MSEPVSKEIVDKVLAAQQAITKLEKGSSHSKLLTADEIAALTWAVLEVTQNYLFSHDPLSEKDLEKAAEIASRIRVRVSNTKPAVSDEEMATNCAALGAWPGAFDE